MGGSWMLVARDICFHSRITYITHPMYGIDFGTTASCIAKLNPLTGTPMIVGSIVPSLLEGGIRYPKRSLRLEDENSIRDCSLLLTKVLADAGLSGQDPPIEAVVAVPVYFSHTRREAVREVCRRAGVEVVALINEPTAIALACGRKDEGIIVADLGGGTFDVSVMDYNEGMYQVVMTGGDDTLGGDDVNRLLENELGIADNDGLIESIKKKAGGDRITRERFLEICEPFYEKIVAILQQVTRDLCFQGETTEGRTLLLTGQGSLLFGLYELVKDKFPFLHVVMCDEPKTLVAKGAALCCRGHREPDPRGIVVVDVTPLTIGVEMADGRMIPIVAKNSILPVKQSRVFTTTEGNERDITIRVYQGERPFCRDNAFIGKIEVKLNRYYQKNEARIMTVFQVTTDGTLSIRVTDLNNEQIDVTTSFSGQTLRLEEARIQSLHHDAEAHRDADAVREQECLLKGRLRELVRVLEANACNTQELCRLAQDATCPEDLKKIIDKIYNEYRRYLLCVPDI